MKVNPAPLHLAQTIITGLVVVFSIAILGTSAHTLDVYNKQKATNPWWTPLWPQHFITHGTKALIASAVVTFVLLGTFLVMSLLPKVCSSHNHYQIIDLATNKYTVQSPPEIHTPCPHLHRHHPPILSSHPHDRRLGTHPQPQRTGARHHSDMDVQVPAQRAIASDIRRAEQSQQLDVQEPVPGEQVCAVRNIDRILAFRY
jgi:hypothetical protein